MNITNRQLQAFLALVELRNFTRAAGQVHLSQPAFSAMIRGLEDDVGAKLFHRDTRRVELTAEGRAFEGPVRRAMAEMDHALAGVRDVVNHRRGKVSVAVLPSLAANWMPPILARYRDLYPAIEIRMDDLLSEQCIERVRAGKSDFAVVAKPVNDSELASTLLCVDHFDLVCRRDHRLADVPTIAITDLEGERFIYQVQQSIFGAYLNTTLSPHAPIQFYEVQQLATVLGMVRAGMGIAAIPELNLFGMRHEDLARRALHFPGLERRLFIVQPSGRELSAAALALFELMESSKPSPRST